MTEPFPYDPLSGRLILVTGATSGIGLSCAVAFARRGANLVLTGRRFQRLVELEEELEEGHGVEVAVERLDVRDRAGVEDWEEMIDTNVKGLLYMTRALLPHMVRRDSGHVINIGSTAGHLVYPRGNGYNATKFAVRALTEGMNLDVAGTRVRVSSVGPGLVETEFSRVRFHGDTERADQVYTGLTPLTPDDIADIVCYVASAPPHVNIVQTVVYPTDQRNAYVIHRQSEGETAN